MLWHDTETSAPARFYLLLLRVNDFGGQGEMNILLDETRMENFRSLAGKKIDGLVYQTLRHRRAGSYPDPRHSLEPAGIKQADFTD